MRDNYIEQKPSNIGVLAPATNLEYDYSDTDCVKIPLRIAEKIKEPVSKRGFSMTTLILPVKWALTPFPPLGSFTNLFVGFNASLTPSEVLEVCYYPNY